VKRNRVTSEAALYIRENFEKQTSKELAERFGITQNQVNNVLREAGLKRSRERRKELLKRYRGHSVR